MQASFSKRRKPVSLTPQSLIRTTSLTPGETFPLVIEPEVGNLDLVVWAAHNREFIETELLKYGAILFRNFEVDTVVRFEEFARAITSDLLDYTERAAPRREVGKNIYTSTDYPADQPIRVTSRNVLLTQLADKDLVSLCAGGTRERRDPDC